MAKKVNETKGKKNNIDGKNLTEAEKKENAELEQRVEEERITLVDSKDKEYEFIILDRLQYEGNDYLALVSCDVKDQRSNDAGPGDGDDITIVREEKGEEISYHSVPDADVLYALSKMLEARYGHLSDADKL